MSHYFLKKGKKEGKKKKRRKGWEKGEKKEKKHKDIRYGGQIKGNGKQKR